MVDQPAGAIEGLRKRYGRVVALDGIVERMRTIVLLPAP
jgi:hypothetical protein